MRHTTIVTFLFLLSLGVHGQKVGLVLSGGGAKGIAHIGVLKALEEHEIPIDYIVGTSMGGIVGGCYAAGISPAQIEAVVLSEEFLRWVNGQHESKYNSYYYSHEYNPGFINLSLSLDSAFNAQVNTSIAKDVTLNFALAEKMAQAEAICNRNFDSLFVPLRVMAAEVFSQRQVVLSSGSLSQALRATQTVPFFYTPIRIDGKYLFDGGVYNNFPVDVMQREFTPDVIIGSNVSSKIFDDYPFGQDDELLNNSMLFMFLDKSDPEDVPASGIYIQPDLRGYTAIDFERAKELIDSGYVQTIRAIEEVKSKINNRASLAQVMARRSAFNQRSFPFVFDEIRFHEFNSKQRKYLSSLFGFPLKGGSDIGIQEVKKQYFNFVSEDYFNNTYPTITFNQQRKKFVFELTRRKQQNFQLDFGGVISSRDVSNIFVGANLYHFDKQLWHGYVGFHTGNFYTSVVSNVRVDYPTLGRFYIEPSLIFNNWNYAASSDLLRENRTTVLNRFDRNYSLRVGWPLNDRNKVVAQVGGISNTDLYINDSTFASTSTADLLKVKGFKTGFTFSSNTLNRKQYASAGGAYHVSAWYFQADEYHVPGNTSVLTEGHLINHRWFTATARAEKYFNKGWFRPGFLVEAAYTTMPFFVNYQGTLINLPSFNPLVDSRTVFLEKFRAKSFVAGGGRVVVSLTKKVDWRVEGYLFKPLESLVQTIGQNSTLRSQFLKASLASTTALVYHSPIGPISLMGNYYDDRENEFGVMMHVGFLLFNKPSLE